MGDRLALMHDVARTKWNANRPVGDPEREQILLRETSPADAGPWLFETMTGKWNRLRTGTTAPKSGYGDTLIYLPARKQAFFAHRNEEVWFYDTAKDSWKRARPEGPPPPFGIDATSCYDPKRERI
jgi:hypothetical protein